MNELLNLEPWWRFAAAIGIGSLIGLERQFFRQKEDAPDFAGIRTYSLISLLGALSAYLVEDLGLYPFVISFIGVMVFTLASYLGKVFRHDEEEGITTEISVLLTFLLGASLLWSHPEVPAALAVIITLILSSKRTLRGYVDRMKGKDLRAALQFGLVSLVILPILPNQTVDPWNVLNPFRIWLLVVFISGIGFFGYVLIKSLGDEKGMWLSGILGGIVSSTATTLSFSARSKDSPKHSSQYTQSILLATAAMFPRVLITVGVIYPPLIMRILLPICVMMVVTLLVVFVLYRMQKNQKQEKSKPMKLKNPLNLSTAIVFGIIFAVVLLVVEFARRQLGTGGVYLASIITGVTGVDAIILTASELSLKGQLAIQVAAASIFIGVVMNTISKGVIAFSTGAKEMKKPVTITFGIISLVGILLAVLVYFI